MFRVADDTGAMPPAETIKARQTMRRAADILMASLLVLALESS
jgi:hypothetical protein